MIILGRDQLRELTEEKMNINRPMTINSPFSYDHKFMGIEVMCLPHIDGMFVIPETS